MKEYVILLIETPLFFARILEQAQEGGKCYGFM